MVSRGPVNGVPLIRPLRLLFLACTLATGLSAQEVASQPEPAPEHPALSSSRLGQDALLVVTAREGSGSGFVGRLKGRVGLFTNAHVIAGASRLELKLLSGDPVTPGAGQLAIGHDVASFEAPDSLLALEICPDVNKEVSIGDEVVVYGNSLGASVVTELPGKVVGLGPEILEVDAPFVPGNSGSPIIHLKSGKVIGIASYVQKRKHDEFSKDSGVAEVRRFGYRLDTIKEWQVLHWPLFQQESALIHGIEEFTDDYYQFWLDLGEKDGRISLLSSGNPRIQRHVRNLQKEAQISKSRSQFDRDVTSFLWALQTEAKQEFLPNKPVPRYWFTNHEWNKQKEMREEIGQDLHEEISERNARSN